jgi:histone deacetylase 1/2
MSVYQPGAVVLQCGTDSLCSDRLGCFSLTHKGHAECVEYMKSFKVPLLVTGGGGYTKHNVARCWTYETAVLVDMEVPEQIPPNDYFQYYAPSFQLSVPPKKLFENLNTRQYLEGLKRDIFEHLRQIQAAPSVQMHHLPPEHYVPEYESDDVSVRFSFSFLPRAISCLV